MRNHAIGIAGYMGSGKSMCARYVAQAIGAEVIDADAVAKELMQTDPEIRRMLTQSFGEGIFDRHEVSFSTLGKQVFSDEEKLLRLNTIVHPYLVDRLWELIRKVENKPVVLDAALISYWRIEQFFEILIWVDASESKRLDRIEKKTDIPREQIIMRMHRQQSLFASPIDKKWHVVTNEQSPEELRAEIVELIRVYGIQKGACHDV